MNSQIRVLHILHSMNRGGAENAIMNYYRFIDKSRVQFDFLLTDPNHCSFEDELISLGSVIYRAPLLSFRHPFRYLRFVNCFFKEHKEYKIVHSHTSSKSFFPLLLAKHNGIQNRICHSHSSKTDSGIKGIVRKLLMPLLKLVATDYLACGEQAAIWLYGKEFVEDGKVQIFKNVIDASLFRLNNEKRGSVRLSLGINPDQFVIGHTARFHEVKNHLFDLEILNEALKIYPETRLLLVGDGDLKSTIIEKANQLGILDKVIMAGVVSNVSDYEQAMDAFILPSFYEGLPLSIIEAQTSGLPCFTTKDTVSPECSVTELVHYLPLDSSKEWATLILNEKRNQRKDRYDEIVQAGYDAKTSAGLLQHYYEDKITAAK